MNLIASINNSTTKTHVLLILHHCGVGVSLSVEIQYCVQVDLYYANIYSL